MMRLKVQQVRPDEFFHAPTKAHASDAGLDLYCSREAHIPRYGWAQLPTNTAIALPRGYWALLLGRSSTFFKRHLLVHQGTIDPEFVGELMGLVFNPTSKRITVQAGDRLFQLIPQKTTDKPQISVVQSLPKTKRGAGGIGSSGK